MVEKYALEPVENYTYLNQSGTFTVQGVDDKADFQLTLACMKNIGFSELEVDSVLNIVVAILFLGNVYLEDQHKAGTGDVAVVTKDSEFYLNKAAHLL